ncbi:AzlC family ABC transporter permease [Dialister sp.]|uniref:AzlC family ABC transporter permease n=1 Tax=Dialister sp. TaxID=1955814 RepID=UPI002E822AA9|nr:AzlC family ABC transporter permease [Dialister sp.]MEE3452922.1 AzlC family ABC transporter permease [Dialister sp.]
MKESMSDSEFIRGVRDGASLAGGYFAVAFSLGIASRGVGMNAIQGFFLSFLNNASAGEYAVVSAISTLSSLLSLALLVLITNARYFLMSCALSQKLAPDTGLFHRLLLSWGITDELFGLAIAKKGYVEPSYLYGAYLSSLSCWALGTSAGVTAGNALPPYLVTALGASIFGMFLAIILPAAKKDRAVFLTVLSGFILSGFSSEIPFLSSLSEPVRVILLTLLISSSAAILKPVKVKKEKAEKPILSSAPGKVLPQGG